MDNKKTFQWSIFLANLSSKIDDLDFESWIKPLSFHKVESGCLFIYSPSKFIKDWVLSNYKEIILTEISKYSLQMIEISIMQNASPTPKEEDSTKDIKQITNSHNNSNIFNLEMPLNPIYTFDNFVVDKSNEFVYASAQKVARDITNTFNPLFIYGGVGLGKTHLMHAMSWEISQQKNKRKVVYLTAEKFVSLFIQALREKNIFHFKEMFRGSDVLMIDDFQFIAGKEQTQEEFFHTFNSLISQGKQIVFTADKPPSELNNIEERIVSRIQSGLCVNIHSTTYELRVGILDSKAKILNVKLPRDVVDFLAHTITSNVRELEGALRKIVSHYQMMNTKIDLNSTITLLEDTLKYKNKAINIEDIKLKVSEHYNIKFVDLSSNKKDKATSFARHIAMYIAKQITRMSLPEIGRKFGGRDHTTVIYSVNKISKLIKKDINLEKEINLLINIIQKN